MDSVITEHDCNVLGGLFQIIVNDLKGGSSTWEDFLLKASKFQSQLKATIAASTAFLDSFQKVADMATTTRGGTKEIGTALTRLCLRHRSVEAKLKSFSSAIFDCLILPLQDRIEEWKKATLQLDKEHNKELKRLRQEFKKRQICDPLMTSNSFRAKKHGGGRMGKSSKYDFGIYGTIGANNKASNSSLSRSLDSEMESNERLQQSLMLFEALEKKAVSKALIEERSHFCLFVKFLRPVVEEEIAMISEISHIQEIMESLGKLTTDPFDLPPSSEAIISNLKLSKNGTSAWNLQTPPSSPSSLGSRKSSMCSISSYNSSSSSSTYGQTGPNKYLSLTHIPSSTYTSTIYSESKIGGQPESVFQQVTKKSHHHQDSSSRQPFSSDSVSTSTVNHRPYETGAELQFTLDSSGANSPAAGHSEATTTVYYKNQPLVLHSTNPFLNSYTPPEGIYGQSTGGNSHLTSTSSTGYSSGQSEGNIYSDGGSITPTNNENNASSSSAFALMGGQQTMASKSSKPPPAPPVRRTSSISDPNAITLGTLKSVVGLSNSNLEEACKNLSVYDEINVLTKSMNDINYTLKYTDFSNANAATLSPSSNLNPLGPFGNSGSGGEEKAQQQQQQHQSRYGAPPEHDKSEYQSVKSLFENYHHPPISSRPSEDDASQLPLPAPPPEAFIETPTRAPVSSILSMATSSSSGSSNASSSQQHSHHPHYNKITNVHREFLETLNSKLSQSPLAHQSPNQVRMSKRRSSSQSASDHEDVTSSYSKPRSSTRSSSTTRVSSSRKNSFEKSTLIGNFRESFMDKLSNTLAAQKYTNAGELAKAAASTVLQRKQSVPDLNELNNASMRSQNRVTFSSTLNLNAPSASSPSAFQVVQIQTNSTQQPIYASRNQLHREIADLYGSLGHPPGQQQQPQQAIYGSLPDRDASKYQNGFYNKL